VTREVQQQHVVRPAVREQFFNLRLDDMCRLVTHYLHGEVTDLGIAEHPAERLGVCRWRHEVPQCLLVVLVVCDDQGFPLAAHCPPSPAAWRLTNSSISHALIADTTACRP
jgi:hypothetical protein